MIDIVAVAECVPSRVTDVGEIPQLRPPPFGTVQVNPIAPTKFASGEIVNVELVEPPGETLAFLGETEIVKFGGMIWKTTPDP